MEAIIVISLAALTAITTIAIAYICARYRITIKKEKDGSITVREINKKGGS